MYKFLIYVKKLDEENGVLYLYLLQGRKVVHNSNLYCKIIIRQDWITNKEKRSIQCILIPAPYFLFLRTVNFIKEVYLHIYNLVWKGFSMTLVIYNGGKLVNLLKR